MRLWSGILALLGTCAAAGVLRISGTSELVWSQDTFEDFQRGSLLDSGVNLYVTRSGSIESVNRFDLNGDGYLDLVFNSSHDEVRALAPSCMELTSGNRTGSSCELPTPGTSLAETGDLNRDGFPDLVLAPNNDGVTARRYISIFWGDRAGWSGRRRTGLLSIAPLALQIADINGDQWPDILVLNGTRWAREDGPEQVLRVYWGSQWGPRQEDWTDFPIAGARDVKVRDLDGDGRPDIAVLVTRPGRVQLYWNRFGSADGRSIGRPVSIPLNTDSAGTLVVGDYTGDGKPDLIASGGGRDALERDPTTGATTMRFRRIVLVAAGAKPRTWQTPKSIDTPPLTHFVAADGDRDGYLDLFLADRTASAGSLRVLWGTKGGVFSAPHMLAASPAYASALAVDDVDGDGYPDIAVGTARDTATYQAKSVVLFGDGKRGFHDVGVQVDTAEVTGVAVASWPDERVKRLVFCNNRAGRINEDVPVVVYWGGPEGFATSRTSRFSVRSGYASAAADLNHDGFPDLVLLSIVHAVREDHPGLGFNILWGGRDGLNDARRTVIREYGLWGLSIADVDRDGYLDLIGNCNRVSPAGEPMRVVIWHGGPNGFGKERRVMLPCEGAEGQNLVADFNRDGFLDIAVARELAHSVSIFWGGAQGFSASRQSLLPLIAANDLKAADLDRDGWLDLVVTSHKMPQTEQFDYGTVIFWGGPKGFRPDNAQRLPAHDGIGITIADFDHDGFLDIYLPGYHYGNTRESVASHIFWGSSRGFSDMNRTDLMQDGGHGAMAADFNRDGKLDLAVACHSKNGTHTTNSLVFYGDGKRFAEAIPQRLPTTGPHFMQRADVGNIYDRSWTETYLSDAFCWEDTRRRATLHYEARIPPGARLRFSLRFAPSQEGFATRNWVAVPDEQGAGVQIPPTSRCVQYRAVFVSSNGDAFPALDRVEVRLAK